MSNINAIYNLNNIPFFTYGMIGITTVVLAIVTMMDNENSSFAKDDGYEKVSTGSSGSMFGNPFTSSKDESKEGSKEESMFGNPFASSKDESKEESMVLTSDKPEQKQGGNRRTKHNKRQNTYTRRK